jgi:hypothetical protein
VALLSLTPFLKVLRSIGSERHIATVIKAVKMIKELYHCSHIPTAHHWIDLSNIAPMTSSAAKSGKK